MVTFATTEDVQSEKSEGTSSSVNGQANIDSLPDDIVSDILVRIPTKDIYNAARLVRRKWCQMIKSPDFIKSHLQRTTLGLLIWNSNWQTSPIFVAMRQDQIEISKLNYEFTGLLRSGCNGLILGIHGDLCQDSYILNPATKQWFDLPSYFPGVTPKGVAIAYAPTSMVYKVVRLFFHILTVGVDKSWRRIVNSENLPGAFELLTEDPLTIEGFVFWAQKDNVLMLNVETEIFTVIPFPLCHDESLKHYYFSTGSYLSLLVQCTKFSWEVWELKPETGEWTKLTKIDLEAQKCKFEKLCRVVPFNRSLKPVGWLNYPEVLVFNHNGWVFPDSGPARLCFAYNLHTQEVESFELESDMNRFLVHRNSLLLLDGCLV